MFISTIGRLLAVLAIFVSISFPAHSQTLPNFRVAQVPADAAEKQIEKPEAETKSEAPETEEPEQDPRLEAWLATPADTLQTFLSLTKAGKFSDATLCLDLSDQQTVSKAVDELRASRLKRVIEQMVYLTFDGFFEDTPGAKSFRKVAYSQGVSDESELNDADLIIISESDDGFWRFDPKTVAAIDDLYGRWKDKDPLAASSEVENTEGLSLMAQLVSNIPDRIWTEKFLFLSYFDWICLAALIFIGFLVDFVVRVILRMITHGWFRYFRTEIDYQAERGLWKPVGLLSQALVWYGGTTLIGLPARFLDILEYGLILFTIVAAVWTAFLLINLLANFMAKKAEKTRTKFDDLLIPLISKTLKTLAIAAGFMTAAQAFDLPIFGLLGGLGIGGMAVAFAAKDAVSNLFGSVTVLVDRPFEVGDWIVAEGVEGTVETVGFRSTRVRTFYNSLISVPNSRFTTASVDNMGRRRYRRIKTTLGLQYDTTPEQVDAFCEGVRELLRRHPYTRKDYYHVYLNQFSASSIDVMLYCFVECPDWSVELRERHRLFLDIMRLAQQLGVSFAFPTRTLHMHSAPDEPATPHPGLSNPTQDGKNLAARIAGPLRTAEERPGGVQFSGPFDPTDMNDDTNVADDE